jgi:hypothetical protein
MRFVCLTLSSLLVIACAVPASQAPQPAGQATSILLIGDTGYDYDWLDQDDYDDRFTAREFVIDELDDWIEDQLPIEDFRLPPMHFAEQTGGYVMASGMWPVARAATRWCAPAGRCDFGLMLGDNIYPSGATLGADGRDDKERFDQLMWQPYKGLLEQDDGFVIYPVLGNHDWETSREGALLQVEYLQQSPLYDMDGLFYRKRVSRDIEIFAIDTTVLLAGQTVYADALNPDGSRRQTWVVEDEVPWATPQGDEQRMLEWLEAALADSDARWKLVIGHHPIWSSSGTKLEEAAVLRELLVPVLCRYADAYIAGHDHMLEVHTDDCRDAGDAYLAVPPLLQIVSGAAGKQRPAHRTFMAWQDREYAQKKTLYVEALIWGFGELGLAGDTATVQMITTPRTGNGDTGIRYTGEFARRSQHLPAADR